MHGNELTSHNTQANENSCATLASIPNGAIGAAATVARTRGGAVAGGSGERSSGAIDGRALLERGGGCRVAVPVGGCAGGGGGGGGPGSGWPGAAGTPIGRPGGGTGGGPGYGIGMRGGGGGGAGPNCAWPGGGLLGGGSRSRLGGMGGGLGKSSGLAVAGFPGFLGQLSGFWMTNVSSATNRCQVCKHNGPPETT